MMAEGIDPGQQRKAAKATRDELSANSFEVICREWLAKWGSTVVPAQKQKATARLEKDVFPWMGSRPIAEITAPRCSQCCAASMPEVPAIPPTKSPSEISQCFRYAIATGRAERDPCPDLRGAIPPVKTEHMPSITDHKQVAELLRAFDAFRGTFVVKSALLLAPLLFVRPGELRKAEWSGFDLDKAEWRYLVTKTKTEHLVPLATQAVSILRELHALTGRQARIPW